MKILLLILTIFSFSYSEEYTLKDGNCVSVGALVTQYACEDTWLQANFVSSNMVCVPGCVCDWHEYTNVDMSFCVSPSAPTVTGNVVSSSGTNIVHFSDDAIMMIFSDGKAMAWDIDGNEIPNRAFNGTTPPLATFEENQATNPTANKKYMDIKLNGYTFLGFQQDGKGFFHSTGINFLSGALLAGTAMLLSPTAVTGGGESIVKTPSPTVEHPNATTLNVTEVNFDNIDFSEYETKATPTPQPIPETNLLYEKLMDATRQASSFPSAKVGDTVIYPSDNPSTYINTNPDTIEMATKQADGSTKELTIDRTSFSNVYNGSADLPYTTATISAPKINNDGTTSVTTTTTSQGFVTSETTVTTDANGSTSYVTTSPSIYNQGGGITSTNGTPTNVDLSGVTSRLDKISNQFTKQNEFIDKLDKASVSDIPHGIPTDATAGDWTSWSTTWNNLKSDIDTVSVKGDELKALVSGGLTLSLTGGEVTTCQKNYSLDLFGTSIPVSFDLCTTLSTARPVFYTLIYISFVFMILMFSVKTLFRMV